MEIGKPTKLSEYPEYWFWHIIVIGAVIYLSVADKIVLPIIRRFRDARKEASWTPEQRRLMKLGGVTKDGQR